MVFNIIDYRCITMRLLTVGRNKRMRNLNARQATHISKATIAHVGNHEDVDAGFAISIT